MALGIWPTALTPPKRVSVFFLIRAARPDSVGRIGHQSGVCALVALTINFATGRAPTRPTSLERSHLGTASKPRNRAALRKAGAKRSTYTVRYLLCDSSKESFPARNGRSDSAAKAPPCKAREMPSPAK